MKLLAALFIALPITIPLGLPSTMLVPKSNPLTLDRINQGKRLFFDERLSRDGTISCATCHRPDHWFADRQPLAVGIRGRVGGRRVPALLNRGYGREFFWDGRAGTLEEAVLMPIENPDEMDFDVRQAALRVNLSESEMAGALASYVRSILAGNSAFDQFIRGDIGALGSEQKEGLEIFLGAGRCSSCHNTPTFTDEKAHNTGVGWTYGKTRDEGYYRRTRRHGDQGAFKTPSLRDVARRPPYMHDGSLATLEEVVDFYDKGGIQNPYLDPRMRPLHLSTSERAQLVAFLKGLNGDLYEASALIATGRTQR